MSSGIFMRTSQKTEVRENRMGGCRGGSCNSRFVLKPDVATASTLSISSKNAIAITDFLTKTTQLVNYCENPLPGTTPPIRDSQAVRHSHLRRLKNEIYACKTRLKKKIQGMVSIQNEIETRYEFAYFETLTGQDRAAFQYTLSDTGLYWSARCPKTPPKRLKNEFRMNFGSKFPPPLI